MTLLVFCDGWLVEGLCGLWDCVGCTFAWLRSLVGLMVTWLGG
jgi:hypothetical protein